MTAEAYRRAALRCAILTAVLLLLALVMDASRPLYWAAGTMMLAVVCFLAARWRLAGAILGTLLASVSLVVAIIAVLRR